MKNSTIRVLEKQNNKKGDLFAKLMSDVMHSLGYNKPRFNIHKSGREIDLQAIHRVEKKVAIAECKATNDCIGGSDINKFVGTLDAEKRRLKRNYKKENVVGYFISMNGFTETAIEQEEQVNNERVLLLGPEKIISELVKGKIIVSVEQAIDKASRYIPCHLSIASEADLLATEEGWIWALYYKENHIISHVTYIHAEGEPLIKSIAEEILKIDNINDGNLNKLTYINESQFSHNTDLDIVTQKYLRYIETECGEIHFEGMPTDNDTGSIRVKLENIFVPLHIEQLNINENAKEEQSNLTLTKDKILRKEIGITIKNNYRIAILAKPGGGKSTLIKRMAVAYAHPERRSLVNDNLPDINLFPIFIKCRELGDKVNSGIKEIIKAIPEKGEFGEHSKDFFIIVSEKLQGGNLLLLIDGLDEISSDKDRINFVNQLRTFIGVYPNIRLIVTSREAGFRAIAGTISSYCTQYKISKLSGIEIETLCINWHKAIINDSQQIIKESKLVAKSIIEDKRISALAENPLLLTTLLFVKRWAGYIPTKKSVLYQEMIKLLLVTWNVQGHEQLEIEETEPQLAYVAFYMTSEGKQTITEIELKKQLQEARKRMPEILSYTRVSVSEFIKRVELRSSLLIMSGNQVENGQLTPIYEFLHLSFQEYLTAKAIVEEYSPDNVDIKSIIKLKMQEQNWREIIPLLAVMSKKEVKDIIEILINECKRGLQNRHIDDKISPVELLGNCLANEIRISPDQLETAIFWYIRSFSDYRLIDANLNIHTLLKSKFKSEFKSVLINLLIQETEAKYFSAISSVAIEYYIYSQNRSNFSKQITNQIINDINDDKKDRNIFAIYAIMHLSYTSQDLFNRTKQKNNAYIEFLNTNKNMILNRFFEFLQYNDSHYNYSVCWALAWLSYIIKINDNNNILTIFPMLHKLWLNSEDNVRHMSSWSLSRMLTPNINVQPLIDVELENYLDSAYYDLEKTKFKAIETYGTRSPFDINLYAMLGFHLNKKWTKNLLQKLSVQMQKSKNQRVNFSIRDEVLIPYFEAVGIDITPVDI